MKRRDYRSEILSILMRSPVALTLGEIARAMGLKSVQADVHGEVRYLVKLGKVKCEKRFGVAFYYINEEQLSNTVFERIILSPRQKEIVLFMVRRGEAIYPWDHAEELGLRSKEGVRLSVYRLAKRGLVKKTKNGYVLTKRGMMLADFLKK